MSRAGWSGGRLRASKLYQSSSTSGPSTVSNPRCRKMSQISCMVRVMGCRRPRGGRRPGKVTSRTPAPAWRAAVFNWPALSAKADSKSCLAWLASWPNGRRSSGSRSFKPLRIWVRLPLRPRYLIRSSSRSSRPAIWLICARASFWRRFRSPRERLPFKFPPFPMQKKDSPGETPVPPIHLQPDNSVPPAFNGKRKTVFLPAGELGHLGESLGIEDGQVRQDFAVQRDLGLFQAADKFTVGEPQGAQGGIDADDPQGAELPLAHLAVPVGEG